MSNLSDSKKREANDLNNNMLGQLSKEFDYLSEGKTAEGQMFIRIGVVCYATQCKFLLLKIQTSD